MTPVSGDGLALLKSRFAEAGCNVTEVDGTNFQIIHPQYPVATHVQPNPFFLQLTTILHVQGQGFRPNSQAKLHTFLAKANSRSHIVKFTDGSGDFGSPDEGWSVAATAKLITGAEGLNYDVTALGNLVTLWTQDIATCVAKESEFKVVAMIEG